MTPDRIIALAPNWLGDAVMCTPALRALHQRYPAARIDIVGRRAVCDLLRGLPWLNAFIPIPARPALAQISQVARLVRRQGRPDLAVVFPHSFRAALLARAMGARRRIGYARNGRAWLLTDAIPPYCVAGRIQPIYMAREYLELLRTLGCEEDGQGLELRADPEIAAQIDGCLASAAAQGAGPLIGFAPGAAFGPSKRWPAERYAAVADLIGERLGARCVLLTGPGEEDTRRAVLAAARTPLIVCDEGRPTLDTLKASVARLDLLICNDSGPRHVAVAFGVPTVCVMGSTAPCYSEGPYERGEVLRAEVECSPCQKPTCELDHRCMTRIEPSAVASAVDRVLRAYPRCAKA